MKNKDNRIFHFYGAATLITVLIAGLWLSGCATTIVPPATPISPRHVMLLDHGRHASLALARAEGDVIRYSYGDWNFYALRKETAGGALSALFASTEAALGRRELKGPLEEEAIRRQLRVKLNNTLTIEAESEAVDALIAELDEIFEANRDTMIYNEVYDLKFVRHPTPYTMNHNSNRVVAGWLETLGCEVRGAALISNWRLANPKSR